MLHRHLGAALAHISEVHVMCTRHRTSDTPPVPDAVPPTGPLPHLGSHAEKTDMSLQLGPRWRWHPSRECRQHAGRSRRTTIARMISAVGESGCRVAETGHLAAVTRNGRASSINHQIAGGRHCSYGDEDAIPETRPLELGK
ncbi:hypothetical protein MBOT_24730 [Mycobacterium botniense]|uniref:Uncharacterized protein n=1 Tax=Mycobacterium botniense TaxID=84962 RepID=A0A7I9XZ76_9MYCO|nr:hypothetical protein MBOT_24730 [Mycobacterium botniense]